MLRRHNINCNVAKKENIILRPATSFNFFSASFASQMMHVGELFSRWRRTTVSAQAFVFMAYQKFAHIISLSLSLSWGLTYAQYHELFSTWIWVMWSSQIVIVFMGG